jgi:hypothetical protein
VDEKEEGKNPIAQGEESQTQEETLAEIVRRVH